MADLCDVGLSSLSSEKRCISCVTDCTVLSSNILSPVMLYTDSSLKFTTILRIEWSVAIGSAEGRYQTSSERNLCRKHWAASAVRMDRTCEKLFGWLFREQFQGRISGRRRSTIDDGHCSFIISTALCTYHYQWRFAGRSKKYISSTRRSSFF